MRLSPEKKGVIALTTLAFGFGATTITTRYLSGHFHLFQQLYLSLLAAFVLSLFIFGKNDTFNKLFKLPRRDWFVLLFRALVGYLLAASLYRQSLSLTKISNVAFIQAIPFTAVFGWIIFKERMTAKKMLPLCLAYFGVLLISVKDPSGIFSFGRGEIFSFVSAAFFSLSYLASKWHSKLLNEKEITQILLFFGFMILFFTSLLSGEGMSLPGLGLASAAVIFIAGLINAVNIFLINYGFKHVSSIVAGNILTLEAVFAVILAIIFYREWSTPVELLGGGLILGSVMLMNSLKEAPSLGKTDGF